MKSINFQPNHFDRIPMRYSDIVCDNYRTNVGFNGIGMYLYARANPFNKSHHGSNESLEKLGEIVNIKLVFDGNLYTLCS